MQDNSSGVCKLCNQKTNYLFSLDVYKSIRANYYECEVCKTLQSNHLDSMSTKELEDFYQSVVSLNLDTGEAWRQYCIVSRIQSLVQSKVIRSSGKKFKVLDFGSGSGFAASCLKLKLGWDTYTYEPYVETSFTSTKTFKSIDEVVANQPYDLIIASEIFEHLNNPLITFNIIRDILNKDLSYVFVTTGLYKPNETDNSWSYLAPMSGQHVIFYSAQSMKKVEQILETSNIYQVGTDYEWIFIKKSDKLTKLSNIYIKMCLKILRILVDIDILPKIE